MLGGNTGLLSRDCRPGPGTGNRHPRGSGGIREQPLWTGRWMDRGGCTGGGKCADGRCADGGRRSGRRRCSGVGKRAGGRCADGGGRAGRRRCADGGRCPGSACGPESGSCPDSRSIGHSHGSIYRTGNL